VDLMCMAGVVTQRTRLVSLGLLISAQTLTTAVTLRPILRGRVRAPAWYCTVLLVGFSAINAIRSVVVMLRVGSPAFQQRLGFLTFALFIVVSLGLAFGFLWMTTASLTAEIEVIASTDPLTRLFNRRVFLKWCEKELLRSQRAGVPFSLLMLDLDHFKQVNDNFGHQRGDEVLCAAVERMQDSVRGIDVLCRWGGEEFAVLLPNATVEATQIVAERIRENIFRMGVPLEAAEESPGAMRRLTVSIGAATYRDLDDDIGAMLVRADRALYQAKGAGRNQVTVGA
jgi:diguanylate cyclase (GGDEF)-like protein